MSRLLLNTIALDPDRWTPGRTPHFDLTDLLPSLAAYGFLELEAWESHVLVPDDPAFTRLQAAVRDGGFAVPIVGMYPALFGTGEAYRAEQDRQGRLLDRAATLGAVMVKCFAGERGTDGLTPRDFAHALSRFRALLDGARERGLLVTVETHANTLCDSVEACRTFFEAAGSERLFLCFQPFDFTDTASVLADYDRLAPYVRHLHLQGRRGGDFSWLETADIEYARLFAAMKDQGFDDFVCIEFVKDGAPQHVSDFDLDLVLRNAERDRAYVLDGPLFT